MRSSEVMIRPAVYADIPALVGLLKDLFSIEADFVCNEAWQQTQLICLRKK